MPGPSKPDYIGSAGEHAQVNYDFLTTLWESANDAERTRITGLAEVAGQRGLRDFLLSALKIEVPINDSIVVVDLQNAKRHPDSNPGSEKFYVLMLPPKPIRDPRNSDYIKMQAWNTAWYHALNDSYGM